MPTLERPAKATSGSSSPGRPARSTTPFTKTHGWRNNCSAWRASSTASSFEAFIWSLYQVRNITPIVRIEAGEERHRSVLGNKVPPKIPVERSVRPKKLQFAPRESGRAVRIASCQSIGATAGEHKLMLKLSSKVTGVLGGKSRLAAFAVAYRRCRLPQLCAPGGLTVLRALMKIQYNKNQIKHCDMRRRLPITHALNPKLSSVSITISLIFRSFCDGYSNQVRTIGVDGKIY